MSQSLHLHIGALTVNYFYFFFIVYVLHYVDFKHIFMQTGHCVSGFISE